MLKFKAFKAPIGIGAMHREYEILCYLNGTPNKGSTDYEITNNVAYQVAIQDLIAMGLIEADTDIEGIYRLTLPGYEVFRLCHHKE